MGRFGIALWLLPLALLVLLAGCGDDPAPLTISTPTPRSTSLPKVTNTVEAINAPTTVVVAPLREISATATAQPPTATPTSLPTTTSTLTPSPEPTASATVTPTATATAAPTTTETATPTTTPNPTRTTKPTATAKPTRTTKPSATPKPTKTSKPTATTAPADTDAGGDWRFVASKKARKYYYCRSDPAWQDLAAGNLVYFNTEAEVQAAYPGLVLHAPCTE